MSNQVFKRSMKAGLASLALGIAGISNAAPVLTNGSFETVAASGLADGWSFTGTPTSSILTSSFQFGILPQDGLRYVTLGGNGTTDAQLSQTITGLNTGESYRLSFWLSLQQLPEFTTTVTERVGVTVGTTAQQIFAVTGNFQRWAQYSYDFTASAATALLTVNDFADPRDALFNVGIDNFQVASLSTQPPANVPVPASAALLGLGMLGLVFKRIAKRKSP